jgi:hypothetical protein
LNFAATRKRFALEEKKCTAHYAPREAMLFYYPSGDEGPRRAVSMRGEPYSEKPYAFGHHRAFDARCADQLHDGMAALAKKTLEGRKVALASGTAPVVPVPLPRPNLASDPDTLANRAGGFSVRAHHSPPPIRIVGTPYVPIETISGPPRTIDGFKAVEPRDFGPALREATLDLQKHSAWD